MQKCIFGCIVVHKCIFDAKMYIGRKIYIWLNGDAKNIYFDKLWRKYAILNEINSSIHYNITIVRFFMFIILFLTFL